MISAFRTLERKKKWPKLSLGSWENFGIIIEGIILFPDADVWVLGTDNELTGIIPEY